MEDGRVFLAGTKPMGGKFGCITVEFYIIDSLDQLLSRSGSSPLALGAGSCLFKKMAVPGFWKSVFVL